jgi:predicted nucleotidyltransferase component of viral defense system
VIAEAELRRLAARNGIDPMVQDLDYSLGWLLAGIFLQPAVSRTLAFKGGTCLRKCYFADYRFSEDLDFTLLHAPQSAQLTQAVEAVVQWSIEAGGPDFGAAPVRLEVVSSAHGQEALQLRIYYHGPLRWGGAPRSIRLDFSRAEIVASPLVMRSLCHPYSDAGRLPQVQVPCYSLEEMLAEKLRAVGGQRRFAISRDLYDIYRLVQAGVSVEAVRLALPAKLAVKGLDACTLSVQHLRERRNVFEVDWRRRLLHLLPPQQHLAFDTAWQTVLRVVADVTEASM